MAFSAKPQRCRSALLVFRAFLRDKTGLPLLVYLLCSAAWRPVWADNPARPDSVGVVDGESISIEGPMSVEAVNGQVKTILRSGADVRIKSGQARIDLIEGGQIAICGPAHFSVLKSGKALTIAVESGTVHAHVEGELSLTVYTPQVQARPVAIGGGAQDFLVGLDSAGAICIRANRGAVRIEQQLTGQGVLVPQSGDVSLSGGQLETLRTDAGRCGCEIPAHVPQSIPSGAEISRLAVSTGAPKTPAEHKSPLPTAPAIASSPAERPEPIYQVFMPPLRYDASTKIQQDYDPDLIVLVRRVRVRPTLIFQGRVEGDPIVARATAPPHLQSQGANLQRPDEDSTWGRVRTFFRKLWSPNS